MLGYYLPWVVAGGAISSIGYGLLSLLAVDTSVAKWVGYQILYGVGGGCMAAGVSICSLSSPYPSTHHR